MQDQEVIREFLIESHENLSHLDRELVELEKRPGDTALLASIFRTIHTIKGTCGFLAFGTLERVSHHAESLLSQLRSGQRALTPELVSLILETVDAIRKVLASIEATGGEGNELFEDLSERLRLVAQLKAPVIDQTVPVVSTGFSDSTPQAVEKQPAEEAKSSAVADANIRVGVGLLDKLMDLVGELVLTRNQILQFNTEREDAALNATSQRLNLITTELQDGVMKTRMQPIGMVWNKLPRVVRDIAVSLGKQITVQMDGTETELDRTIIEAIKDPLVHLVRNSCDHGIETPEERIRAGKPAGGKLSLRAWHEGGQVNIEIGDDGAGIDVLRLKNKAIETGVIRPEQAAKLTDREALNLVFHPGLSTASQVTNFSGRGVGMDVVKSHVEKIGGVIDIFSRLGEGTWVKLKIPLTLAIIPGLVITSGGERFVIPQVSLRELVRLKVDSSEKRIEYVNGVPVYRRRGNLLPIAWLNQVLNLPSVKDPEALSMIVLQAEDQQFGLMVDGINDTQEIVVKPLGKQLKSLSVYAGATIMGDGHVALILDVHGIGQRSGVLNESRDQNRAVTAEHKSQAAVELQRLLLFRAGSFQRIAVPLSLVARLEEFPRDSVELAGGCQVVQYRGRILPLVSLRNVLEPGIPEIAADSELIQVIVFKDDDRSIGVIVDHILDVAEEFITTHQKSNRKGLLGSAIVGKMVTDFLDLGYVIRSATENWLQGTSGLPSGKRVLVAEASAFSRGLIRSGLDMAGYQVLEASNLGDAIRGLGQEVDAVVAGYNLPPDGCSALMTEMRKNPEWRAIPAIALADQTLPQELLPPCPDGFGDCVAKFDREAMIESLARLAAAVDPIAVATVPGVLAGGKR
jgi:two-component system, chemotaxis family, sensor kinase CheA